MTSIPFGDDPGYAALEAYISNRLKERGYTKQLMARRSVWRDGSASNIHATMNFVFCLTEKGYFFGARESWVQRLRIEPLDSVGIVLDNIEPSSVLARGQYVKNTPAGRKRIVAIIALFPAGRPLIPPPAV